MRARDLLVPVAFALVTGCGRSSAGLRQDAAIGADTRTNLPEVAEAPADAPAPADVLDAGVPLDSAPDALAQADALAQPDNRPDAMDTTDATQASVCGTVTDATFYVDPVAGVDALPHTGARACPFRSVRQALIAVGAQRTSDPGPRDATIAIVNDVAGGVVLDASTGDDKAWIVPAGVTITAADPSGPAPRFSPSVSGTAIDVQGARVHLARFTLDCVGGSFVGIEVEKGDISIDHMTITGCKHAVYHLTGAATLGPGLHVHDTMYGVKINGGTATIVGGRGAERTTIEHNQLFGIWLHGSTPQTSLIIRAAAVALDAPDQAEVQVLDNDVGVFFDASPISAVIHGARIDANQSGILMNGGPSLELRGSYLASNVSTAITAPSSLAGTIDLGASAADPGRNVFGAPNQTGTLNKPSALCFTGPAAAKKVPAIGNVFGAVDCANGGALTQASTCSGHVDIGGATPVDTGACTVSLLSASPP
jgi:hypothetical protein